MEPQFIYITVELKANDFIGSQANFENSVASTGSGGVIFIKIESLNLIIGGGSYIQSKAFYGANFYIETFSNIGGQSSNLEIKSGITIASSQAKGLLGSIVYLKSSDEFSILL